MSRLPSAGSEQRPLHLAVLWNPSSDHRPSPALAPLALDDWCSTSHLSPASTASSDFRLPPPSRRNRSFSSGLARLAKLPGWSRGVVLGATLVAVAMRSPAFFRESPGAFGSRRSYQNLARNSGATLGLPLGFSACS